MKYLIPILFILSSCNYTQTLRVFEKDKVVAEFKNISTTDTLVEIGNYVFKYKINEDQLEGIVYQKGFEGNKGQFKSPNDVKIYIGEKGELKIETGF